MKSHSSTYFCCNSNLCSSSSSPPKHHWHPSFPGCSLSFQGANPLHLYSLYLHCLLPAMLQPPVHLQTLQIVVLHLSHLYLLFPGTPHLHLHLLSSYGNQEQPPLIPTDVRFQTNVYSPANKRLSYFLLYNYFSTLPNYHSLSKILIMGQAYPAQSDYQVTPPFLL